jgi:hypothetical protein
MSKIILPINTTKTIVVNNGAARSFIYNADGTFSIPNNLNIGNTANAFRAIINASNITTADKTFSLPNRTGNIALEDNTSLVNMLPSTTGKSGYVLSNDGGTTFSWIPAGTASLSSLNGIATATYNAQTFATPGTTGTAPNWVSINSNTNTHTLHIPMASATGVTAGLISKTDYDNIGFKNGTNSWTGAQTFVNAPSITNPGTLASHIATLQDVWNARNGVGVRAPVAALDTVTTGTGLPTVNPIIDGYTITLNDRVLGTVLTGGNAGKIYKATVSLNPVTWVLETDGQAGNGNPTDGDIVFVKNGTNYHDQQWAYNGTSWVLYSVAQSWTFSTGLSVSGTTVTVDFAPSGTSSATQAVRADDSRLSNSRTPTAHQLDSATYHTVSGKTAGQVVIATSATTFGFVTFSGDILSISAAGAVVINKIGGVSVNDLGLQQNSATLVDNTAAATLVTGCSWAIATYRTIKIEYSISRGAGNYVTGYLVLLHDGTTPRITIVEDDSIGTHGITFSTDINAGNMRLLYQTTSSGTAATMRFINYTFPV